MKHNFTRDQIEQAVIEAAKKRAGFCVDQMLDSAPHNVTLGEVGDLRAFLSALPELDPSYPEIPIGDVRKGDRVRITTKTGNQYEVTVDRMDSYTWRWNGGSVYIDTIERVYLIERPVKHPDPDKDLVIFDGDGSIWFRSGYGDEYHSPTDFTYFKHPTDFTEWSPARVVADDE